MVCCSCLHKLAARLMRNHKIDMIRAYELAEKALERYEQRKMRELNEKAGALDDPADYTKTTYCDCTMDCPDAGKRCFSDSDCSEGYCSCTPPACPEPKPNSHLVSQQVLSSILTSCRDCVGTGFLKRCRSTGTRRYVRYCYYDCDEGYVWNPETEQCEPVAVRRIYGDGLTWVVT